MPGAQNATSDVKSRLSNLQILLKDYPNLETIEWFVDPPNDSLYHVGGSFNSKFGAWPHCYFVLDSDGKIIFRSPIRTRQNSDKSIAYYVDISDLEMFLQQ